MIKDGWNQGIICNNWWTYSGCRLPAEGTPEYKDFTGRCWLALIHNYCTPTAAAAAWLLQLLLTLVHCTVQECCGRSLRAEPALAVQGPALAGRQPCWRALGLPQWGSCIRCTCPTPPIEPADYSGHGTHCTGSVGAAGNNSLGLTGVAWGVNM